MRLIKMKLRSFFNRILCQMFLFLLISLFSYYKVNAFDWYAHRNITNSVLSSTCFIQRLLSKGEFKDLGYYYNLALEACNKPDEEERETVFRGHFYDYENETPHQPNALTNMVEHYKKSLRYVYNHNKEGFIEELGRALHYLQDMCCPVHLLGWASWEHNSIRIWKDKIMRYHTYYELEIDNKCRSKLCQFNKKLNTSNNGWGCIEKIATYYAEKTYNIYRKYHNSSNTSYHTPNEAEITEIYNNACEACCELIHCFCRDVGINI